MIRGLVFDFDGLILDTEVPVYQAWAEVFARHGQPLELDFWTTIIGYGAGDFDPVALLERRTGQTIDREELRAVRSARVHELTLELEVLPGVQEWRAEATARGVRLAVASSSTRQWVTSHLARLGLDGWGCVRTREDVARAKPAPDLYLAAAECLGIAPAEAIAVEDSSAGVAAAKAAGIYCVAVPSSLTSTHDFALADLVLSSLSQRTFTEVAALAGGL